METEILHKKLLRYLDGQSMPAETNQIQNWLSHVDKSGLQVSDEEKIVLEEEILVQIQNYTSYSSQFPKSRPWWQKITTFF